MTETELGFSAKQICEGLQALHDAGRVHCAVNPSNIVICGQHKTGAIHSELKGLEKSKSVEELRESSLRAKVHSVLRVKLWHYCAPEVISGEAISPASDIWSFGVTLYLLATGQYPFTSKQQILQEAFNFPRKHSQSDEFVQLVTKLLEKDPSQRPTAAEIARDPWFVKAILVS